MDGELLTCTEESISCENRAYCSVVKLKSAVMMCQVASQSYRWCRLLGSFPPCFDLFFPAC